MTPPKTRPSRAGAYQNLRAGWDAGRMLANSRANAGVPQNSLYVPTVTLTFADDGFYLARGEHRLFLIDPVEAIRLTRMEILAELHAEVSP